eukprot:503499_1
MGNRKTVVHEMKENDLIIDHQFVDNPLRPSLMFTTQKTKWNYNEDSSLGPCNCLPMDEPHQMWNDLCRVGLKELYDIACIISDNYIQSGKSRSKRKKIGWYWRRSMYKPGERKKKINDDDKQRYFSYQRWGKDSRFGMGNNLKYLNNKLQLSIALGVNPDAKRNKRFTDFIILILFI